MADISKTKVNNETYNIKDSSARTNIENILSSLSSLIQSFKNLGRVAKTNDYNDLDNKPNIPAESQDYSKSKLIINGKEYRPADNNTVTMNIEVPNVIDSLTETSKGKALDASQGKVLKDLIDEKQNLLKPGQNITIEEDGTISAQGGSSGLSSLNDLRDVVILDPVENQILYYDNENKVWINKTLSIETVSLLSELKDVSLNSVEDSQILQYDSTTNKWINKTLEKGNEVSLGIELINTAEDGNIAVGKYNKQDDNATFIVGNGTSDSSRINSFSIGAKSNV